jgi:hypothetical protein
MLGVCFYEFKISIMFAGHYSNRFCELLEKLDTSHSLYVGFIGCTISPLNNILFCHSIIGNY